MWRRVAVKDGVVVMVMHAGSTSVVWSRLDGGSGPGYNVCCDLAKTCAVAAPRLCTSGCVTRSPQGSKAVIDVPDISNISRL